MKKGIVLSGGRGTRLYPITIAVCKQLLPVYDKPLIYYPLTTLMQLGIKDILIIVSSELNMQLFNRLLGNGDKFGINLNYAIQPDPKGIAEAFLVGEKFIDNQPVSLILGDNIFYGERFITEQADIEYNKNYIFGCKVNNPKAYGVAVFDNDGDLIDIEEKPENPKSDYAVPGLYIYDDTVVDRAKSLIPSGRGELEITDLNNTYIADGLLDFIKLAPGTAWFDTGTHDHLLEAAQFVKAIQSRTGMTVGSPYEVALNRKWISRVA